MKNVTKIRVHKPAPDVFEAFVDPERIGHFWFSSSSERWEAGRTITLRYEEYGAEGNIEVLEIEQDKKIVFRWGNTVTILLHETQPGSTDVEVIEDGFHDEDDNLLAQMLDNKEGWVYALTCLKGYLEFGVSLRAALLK